MRLSAIALPICVLLAVSGCTDEKGDNPATVSPPTPAPASSALPGDAAKAELKRLQPGLDPTSPQGAGPLAPSMGNTLMGKPAKSGTVEFVFACSGDSIVNILIHDRQALVPEAEGQLQCDGRDGFKRTIPVTTESALSFQATATTLKDGGYAYAWSGDIK
ncbi:hypothetical protein [Actinoplanes sp. NPDC026623]|uniref:hypothetical protein n=1 Tax=Actinoplanes sp. NPDC026623 TaxID=3155610 RepID=UPI0033C27C23